MGGDVFAVAADDDDDDAVDRCDDVLGVASSG